MHIGEAIAKNIDNLKPECDKEKDHQDGDLKMFLPFLISPKVGISVLTCLNILADSVENIDVSLL